MTMPRNPASYEQVFHILLENLALPTTQEDIEIPLPSEQDAIKFRLRYYAFTRSVLENAETKLEKAKLLNYGADVIASAEASIHKVMAAKKFKATLEGKSVIFSDRDEVYKDITEKLLKNLKG